MKYEIVKIKEKTLVGLKARIKEEKTAHDTIWNLWKDLYSMSGCCYCYRSMAVEKSDIFYSRYYII